MVWKFCGNTVFAEFRVMPPFHTPWKYQCFQWVSNKSIAPKLCGNCAFPQYFHTMKLGEILVVYAVVRKEECVKLRLTATLETSERILDVDINDSSRDTFLAPFEIPPLAIISSTKPVVFCNKDIASWCDMTVSTRWPLIASIWSDSCNLPSLQ